MNSSDPFASPDVPPVSGAQATPRRAGDSIVTAGHGPLMRGDGIAVRVITLGGGDAAGGGASTPRGSAVALRPAA